MNRYKLICEVKIGDDTAVEEIYPVVAESENEAFEHVCRGFPGVKLLCIKPMED